MSAATHSPSTAGRAASADASRTLMCALIASESLREPADLDAIEALRALCASVAERVEWLGRPDSAGLRGALLDLGRCPIDEAWQLSAQLLAWFAERQFSARVGAGPSLAVAQLAALAASPGTTRVVAPADALAFTQQTPVDALAQLEGQEASAITPEVVARLRRFGLRTLGHVARLDARDPQALRRQFGAAGVALATLAQGRDLRAIQPTPEPERVAARLRFSSGVSPEQALAALPRLAARLARRLAARGRQGRTLRLRVSWESGATTQQQRRLVRPLRLPRELTQAASALLATLLAPTEGAEPAALVASLTLELSDLAARSPAQPTPLFALPPAQRQARERLERIALEVAAPLARRYGAPALYRLATVQPDAILPEERARLVSLSPAERTEPGQVVLRGRQAGAARAALSADEAQALPPQPHWW